MGRNLIQNKNVFTLSPISVAQLFRKHFEMHEQTKSRETKSKSFFIKYIYFSYKTTSNILNMHYSLKACFHFTCITQVHLHFTMWLVKYDMASPAHLQ